MEDKLHLVYTEDSGVSSMVLARMLPKHHCSAKTEKVEQLGQVLAGSAIDAVICSLREAEEAERLASALDCILLLLGDAAEVEAQQSWAISNGFLCGTREQIEVLFPQLLAFCRRQRSLRVREYSLQRKLTDAKLIHRAKLLLVTRLQMSESEAHRYIEKTAMDNGESRRDVALRLIRTYEE